MKALGHFVTIGMLLFSIPAWSNINISSFSECNNLEPGSKFKYTGDAQVILVENYNYRMFVTENGETVIPLYFWDNPSIDIEFATLISDFEGEIVDQGNGGQSNAIYIHENTIKNIGLGSIPEPKIVDDNTIIDDNTYRYIKIQNCEVYNKNWGNSIFKSAVLSDGQSAIMEGSLTSGQYNYITGILLPNPTFPASYLVAMEWDEAIPNQPDYNISSLSEIVNLNNGETFQFNGAVQVWETDIDNKTIKLLEDFTLYHLTLQDIDFKHFETGTVINEFIARSNYEIPDKNIVNAKVFTSTIRDSGIAELPEPEEASPELKFTDCLNRFVKFGNVEVIETTETEENTPGLLAVLPNGSVASIENIEPGRYEYISGIVEMANDKTKDPTFKHYHNKPSATIESIGNNNYDNNKIIIDINGRRISSSPAAGFYIVRRADGTATKRLVR